MKTKNIYKRMKANNQLTAFFIFPNLPFVMLFIIIALLTQSCKQSSEQVQSTAKKIPLVRVQKVEKSTMLSFIDVTGTIQANIFTEVKSPADGIIEDLFARENQYVEKDKLLAVINPTDRVSLISSNIEKIENLERKLKTTDKKSENYQQLLSDFERSKSDLEFAKNMFKTIPVVCPMNGLVTERWLDIGSQVGAKEKILTIINMSSLVIKAEANERYFEPIKQGKKLPIILNAYPNDTLFGIISLVYPQIDPVTRSIKFDIKVQNFNKPLLPGMMASIKIPVLTKDNAFVVPEHSIITSPDNKNFVFVVNKDSLALKRMVQTGISSGNKLEIIKGLKENEKVVVEGQEMLKDSMKVKLIK